MKINFKNRDYKTASFFLNDFGKVDFFILSQMSSYMMKKQEREALP